MEKIYIYIMINILCYLLVPYLRYIRQYVWGEVCSEGRKGGEVWEGVCMCPLGAEMTVRVWWVRSEGVKC